MSNAETIAAPSPIPRAIAFIEADLATTRDAMDSAYTTKGLAARDLKAARNIFNAARDALHALERQHAALERELLEAETSAARALLYPLAA